MEIKTFRNMINVYANYPNVHVALEANEILINHNKKESQTIILDVGKVERFSALGLLVGIKVLRFFKKLDLKRFQPFTAEALLVMQTKL